MTQVFITDYIDTPNLEQEVLGNSVSIESNIVTEVLLVWHEHVDGQYLDQFPKI